MFYLRVYKEIVCWSVIIWAMESEGSDNWRTSVGDLKWTYSPRPPDIQPATPVWRSRGDDGVSRSVRRDMQVQREILQSTLPSMHCKNFARPLLTGRDETDEPHFLDKNDAQIHNLAMLLAINSTGFSAAEVTQMLVRVSQINIRFFHWTESAGHFIMAALFRTRPKETTFKQLKHALKEKFVEWRLVYSNTTLLLKETRIYRPPCVGFTTGNTKPMRGSTVKPFITTGQEGPISSHEDSGGGANGGAGGGANGGAGGGANGGEGGGANGGDGGGANWGEGGGDGIGDGGGDGEGGNGGEGAGAGGENGNVPGGDENCS